MRARPTSLPGVLSGALAGVLSVTVAALPVAGFLLGGLAALPFAVVLASLDRRVRPPR